MLLECVEDDSVSELESEPKSLVESCWVLTVTKDFFVVTDLTNVLSRWSWDGKAVFSDTANDHVVLVDREVFVDRTNT